MKRALERKNVCNDAFDCGCARGGLKIYIGKIKKYSCRKFF